MASPQKENGYTMIANELLEALVKYQFPPKTGLPMSLCMFVIRQTYGYHKKEDKISLTQFQLAVNEPNRTNLIYWLNYLVQAKILIKTKLEYITKWQFNKDYDEWLPLVQVKRLVQVRKYNGASTDTKTSARNDTHKRNKEITKEINPLGDEINKILGIFEKSINPTINYGNTTQRKAIETLIEKVGLERTIAATKYAISIQTDRYAPTITTPIQLLNKYGELQAYYQKHKKINQPSKTLIL